MYNDKFNKQRKRMLIEMDNGIELTNTELGMYDLTPYFNLNIEDPGLIESIMLCKNKTREIEHTGPGLFFSPPQFEALEYLANNRRVILSAPTSFGSIETRVKTFKIDG